MPRLSKLKKSVIANVALKPVGMIISLAYTPILLSYLGTDQYGAWVTVLSVVNWINYFDVGIGNGYRNLLTEALTKRQDERVRSLTRTAYSLVAAIVACAFCIAMLIILALDVDAFFAVSAPMKLVLGISLAFVCVNFVAALCKPQLFALQRSGLVSLMSVSTNGISLILVAGLAAFAPRDMLLVAVAVGVAGLITNLVFSAVAWHEESSLIPRLGSVARDEVGSLVGLGLKFFAIQISGLVLYATDNMIITACLGVDSVTPYSTTNSAFSAVVSFAIAALTPFWSKITQKAADGDYAWISRALSMVLIAIIPTAAGLFALAFFFEPIAELWLGVQLSYDTGLIWCMAVYYVMYLFGSITSTFANGLGRVNLQLVFAVVGAAVNVPLSVFLCTFMGLRSTGVLLATFIALLMGAAPVFIDLKRYISRMAKD